jgi:hypothetical protein
VLHGNIVDDVLQFDAVRFCREMAGAVRNWYETTKNDSNVKRNLPNLVRLRPNGLKPYIGSPLIA